MLLLFWTWKFCGFRFRFRCGFLGMLHMEIIQERLERELIWRWLPPYPIVSYIARTTKGDEVRKQSLRFTRPEQAGFYVEELISKQISLLKPNLLGPVMSLVSRKERLSPIKSTWPPTSGACFWNAYGRDRFSTFMMILKTISKGYASVWLSSDRLSQIRSGQD